MFRVLSCLRDQHDYRLVLLAILICAVASFTAFHIYANARDSQGAKKLGWVFLTGVATGAGIWATHSVAMLAFKTGLPTAYDPALTLASLLIAWPDKRARDRNPAPSHVVASLLVARSQALAEY
jgi:NO-binding membrane sensor protein with MHYT domain